MEAAKFGICPFLVPVDLQELSQSLLGLSLADFSECTMVRQASKVFQVMKSLSTSFKYQSLAVSACQFGAVP